MAELIVKVRISKTVQETRYEPWSIELELSGSAPTETARLSIAKELTNEATRFIDEAVQARLARRR